MKKEIYEVSFTKRRLETIEEIINKTFESYMTKNPEVILTKAQCDHLMGQAKDQLTVYIQEMSNSSDRWTMSHKKIPITVLSEKPKKKKDLMSSFTPDVPEYFTNVKGDWVVSNEKTENSYTKTGFDKYILSQINEGAATAAFYAIESYVACNRVYKDD